MSFFLVSPTTIAPSDSSFYSMNLSRPLLKAVEAMGFAHPTPVQVGMMAHARFPPPKKKTMT